MSKNEMCFGRAVLAAFFMLVSLVGCSIAPAIPELKFNSLVIQNNSGMALEDVKIKVEKTGALAYCSLILPGSSCSTGFPDKRYQGNPIYISWTHNGQSRVAGPVIVELPEKTYGEVSASALLEFGSPELISTRFVY